MDAEDPSFKPRQVQGIGYAVKRTYGGGYTVRFSDNPGPNVNADLHTPSAIEGTSANFALPASFAADPFCQNTGRRFRVVYAYPSNGTNDYNNKVATIRDIVRKVNGKLIQESYVASGNTRAAQLKTQCTAQNQIAVSQVSVPRTCYPEEPGCAIDGGSHVVTSVNRSLGTPNQADDGYAVKYMIFYDKTGTGYTGIGYGFFDTSSSHYTKSKTLNNNWKFTTGSVNYPEYWQTLNTLHEVGHTLGAVQVTNYATSTGGWHCIDGNDVMCYDDGGARSENWSDTNPAWCPNGSYNANGWRYDSGEGMPFDCDYNTYFRSVSGSGDYLDLYWNVGGKEDDFLRYTPSWP